MPVEYAKQICENNNLKILGLTSGTTEKCREKIIENIKNGYYSIVMKKGGRHYFMIANEESDAENEIIFFYESWSQRNVYKPGELNIKYGIEKVYTYKYTTTDSTSKTN